MSNFLDRAIRIADLVHSDEIDKGGNPYILHPIAVMNSSLLQTDEEKAVAILHDVLESKPNTIKYLEAAKMPDVVIESVKLLTRDLNDTYQEYINKIATSGNLIAVKVKLADLYHNTSNERVANLDQKKAAQLGKRYSKAKKVLEPIVYI